jgi:hypothetical protein
MLINVLLYLLILLIFEILITKSIFKILILVFSNLLICSIVSIFFLKLEIFGLTLILVYSSVFLILFLFINYFEEKFLISNFKIFFIFIFFFIFFFLKFYIFNQLSFNFFWINYYFLLKFKIIKFTNLIHVLLIKIYNIETVVINIYLLIGLLSSLTLISYKSIGNKKKLTFTSKNKRIYRRTNSYNSFLNK